MRNILAKMNYLLDNKMKVRIVLTLLVIIVGSFAELLGVAVILPIVNLAMDAEMENNIWVNMVTAITGFEDREQVLVVIIALTVFIYIAKNVYLAWMYSRLYLLSAQVKKQMAMRLLKAYLIQPYRFFLNRNSSDLIRSVNQDTGQLYEVVLNFLMACSNSLTALTLIITLIVVNPWMTLVVVVLLAFCACIVLFAVHKKTRYLGKRNQQLLGLMIQSLQQVFEGIKEIKILQTEPYFANKYGETYEEQTDVNRRFRVLNMLPKYIIEAVCIAGIMIYLAGNIIWNPDYQKIIPQLAVFVMAAYKLLPSVNGLYTYISVIIFNKASIDLVYKDVLEADELMSSAEKFEDFKNFFSFEDKISAEHVSFQYSDGNQKILDDVSFTIPKGKSVAFIGPSGGGKTTTVDVVLGLLTPDKGQIKVDDQDISEYLSAWRSRIGYIPQSIYLIDGTIKANVAMGVKASEIDDELVWKALEEAQMADFVRGLESGLDTPVGERGTKLSGGQRQRIGIARALYRNPEVLVFDEATSALDTETEKEVMKAIDSLHGNKTMIMIAHRLSTIENCDHVYRIENGKAIQER